MLRISVQQIEQIYHHSEQTYPEECCGLLLGTIEGEQKIVLEVQATENAWTPEDAEKFPSLTPLGSKRDRFSIAPEVLLQIQKESRDRQLNLIGIYHSHPDHSAIPSQWDCSLAWPSYSYVIVSVQQGIASEIKSWELDANHRFQEEIIAKN